MFNKKGQEGLTLTTLLLIVLGVVVVIVIILGVTGVFDSIFGNQDVIPGQKLEAIVQSCKISAQAGLAADYCYQFKEIDDDEYVTCTHGLVNDVLKEQGAQATFSCNPNTFDDAVAAFCNDVSETQRDSVSLNGVTCAGHGHGSESAGSEAQEELQWHVSCEYIGEAGTGADVSEETFPEDYADGAASAVSTFIAEKGLVADDYECTASLR